MTAELKKWSRIFYRLSVAASEANVFTNSNKKKTSLLLCLFFIFKVNFIYTVQKYSSKIWYFNFFLILC